MGCGMARFGRRGLKTTETWKFWSQNLSPGVLRRGAPGVSRHGAMGFRGAAQGFRGAAPWGFEGRRQVGWDLKGRRRGFEGQRQVGWDLKGRRRGFEAQQHGTGLSRGYFLYFSATDFKPQSVWWRTLWCLPSSADRQSPFPLETNHSWTKKYFNGEDLSTFFPLLLVQCSSILLGAEMNSLVKVKVKKGKAEGRQSEIVVLYLCHHTSWIVTNKYLALVTEESPPTTPHYYPKKKRMWN